MAGGREGRSASRAGGAARPFRWRLGVLAVIGLWIGLHVTHAVASYDLETTGQTVKRRGLVVVGVMGDSPIWGYRDVQGNLTGLDVDLAEDLADRLGVRLDLVEVTASDRLELLDLRRIDVLIATLSDTPERRREAALLEPHYYSAGVGLLAREKSAIRSWRDIRGKTVCTIAGAFYNSDARKELGIVPLYHSRIDEALLSLRQGKCVGFLYDDSFLRVTMRDPRYEAQYDLVLSGWHTAPWAIAVHRGEENGKFARSVSRIIGDWHRSGRILGLEEKYGLPPSKYLQHMHDVWNRKNEDGSYLCRWDREGELPKVCR